jgi:hypothetical protein
VSQQNLKSNYIIATGHTIEKAVRANLNHAVIETDVLPSEK